jgi:hypothetical protein
VLRGGPTSIPYQDLIHELKWEMSHIRSEIHLTTIDKELHSIYVRALVVVVWIMTGGSTKSAPVVIVFDVSPAKMITCMCLRSTTFIK